MRSRTGTVKARHTPLASAVSYDNAVNSVRNGTGVLGGAGVGLLRSYGEGVFTSVFVCQCCPRDGSLCVRLQGKALWHLSQQLRQHLGEPPVTCQTPQRDPHWEPDGGHILPGAATAPSEASSPSPASARAGTGRSWKISQVLLLQPSWWVFSPRFCTRQRTPPFPHRPHRRECFCLPLSCQAVPVSEPSQTTQLFPNTLQTSGNAPSPSPWAACEALGSAPARGLGSCSPARVPGAGRSCLSSILSRYKIRFQKSELFHWQEVGAARDSQLPQLRFPARPLSQPRSLPVLQTHELRKHRLDS